MSFQTLEAVATGHRVVRVDLLPPEFELARKGQTMKLALGVGLIAVLGACAGAVAISAGHVTDADQALSAEQARTPALQAAQKPYAQVPVVTAQLQQLQDVRARVSANNVPLYSYVDAVAGTVPTGTALTSLVLQINGAPDQGTVGAAAVDPLAVQGVGTLSVNGTTHDQVAVGQLLTNLTTVEGLADPRLSNTSTGDDGEVSFTTTATVTSDALADAQ